jgi:hypothetical protein
MTAPQPRDELDLAVRRLIAETLRPPPPAPALDDRPLEERIAERRRQREVIDAQHADEERLLAAWRLHEIVAEVTDFEQRRDPMTPCAPDPGAPGDHPPITNTGDEL